ncbi:MAG TPA: hypothetical protein VIW45_04200 [Vicinamibacterales bacterium]
MAAAKTPCPRFPAKIQHRTREEALEHQKQLVFRDASTGHPEKSHGLNVFPCEHCGSWHVGHAESLPLVWHYTSCESLDAIIESGALEPGNPRAFVSEKLLDEDDVVEYLEGSLTVAAIPLSRSFQSRYRRGYPKWVKVPLPDGRRHVTVGREMIERQRLLWFTRNEYWEHSIDDPDRETLETYGKGFLRFGVPSSVAKLRWADYLARNATAKLMRIHFGARSDPTQWLATDEAVPLERVKRTELYFGGAWMSIHDVDPAAFEKYIKGRKKVYEAARKTLGAKLDRAAEARRAAGNTNEEEEDDRSRRHDDLLRYFDRTAKLLDLTEAERITFEDVFLLHPQAMALPPPPPLPPDEDEDEDEDEEEEDG